MIIQVYLNGKLLADQGAEGLCAALNYCPQGDTVWPRLTVAEVLRVFARLRGLSADSMTRLIDIAIEALRLEQYRNRRFEALSGGTQRKVSVSKRVIYLLNIHYTL